ncbi:TonB-dependent receptor [Methylobacterium sp. Leaf87]|nr:TonB-dependent receptor [Methylobacterium sp. Leaf87]
MLGDVRIGGALLFLVIPIGAEASGAGNQATLAELSIVADTAPGRVAPGAVSLKGSAPAAVEGTTGESVTRIGREGTIANRAAPTIGTVLLDSPGVVLRQDNGARDVIVSIRGSNARAGRVMRNTVILEDGFPLTQPDGVSRLDLVDPRAYAGLEVFRGPQSALFGNYATGGAIALRTRTGREIDGYEIGTDAGSFGYLNRYFTVGGVRGPVEIALFTSDARGRSVQDTTAYDIQTVDLTARYTLTPDTRFTLKVINNTIQADLPARASRDQYRINPFQRHCETAATAASGCVLTNLFANGAFGATVPVTASQAAFGRDDRRTIVAARFEHDLDAATTWRVQAGFDERNFDQPFYTTSVRGSFPSWNLLTDLSRRGTWFGLPAVSSMTLAYSTVDSHSTVFNRAPTGGPALGAFIGEQFAVQSNLGGRARTDIALSDAWTGVLGISAERTGITGRNAAYGYSTAGRTESLVIVDRDRFNLAPELALVYRPNLEWSFRGRVATGYSDPGATSLFVTAAGLPGNNTGLRTQEALGSDLGIDWTPVEPLRISLTGFVEAFRNELITQSQGAGRLTSTFNAPASLHRGLELGGEWALGSGWRATLSYGFDDQVYTRFVESLSAGKLTAAFDQAGKRIPGVPRHHGLARIGYEQVGGPFRGFGTFLEAVAQDDVFIDTANLLTAPGYTILNANVHYAAELPGPSARRVNVYLEVRNVLDRTYVASALNLANTLNAGTGLQNGAAVLAATPGSIFAGAPRNIVGGMKLSF